MLLRASSEVRGREVDERAVTDPAVAAASGVDHAEVLLHFADALVQRDDGRLGAARELLLERLGPQGLVDAVAVASNFQRMVRIADGCGIPLDPPMELLSGDLRDELGLGRFGSAANTPARGPIARAFGFLLRPVARRALTLIGGRARKA